MHFLAPHIGQEGLAKRMINAFWNQFDVQKKESRAHMDSQASA